MPFRNKLIDVADKHMISDDVQPALLVDTIHRNNGERSEHRNLVRDLAMYAWRIWEIVAVKEGSLKNDLFCDLAGATRQKG